MNLVGQTAKTLKVLSLKKSFDGCWDDWIFSDDIDEAEQERIQEGWEEDAYEFLHKDGWMEDDTYYYAHVDGFEFEPAND